MLGGCVKPGSIAAPSTAANAIQVRARHKIQHQGRAAAPQPAHLSLARKATTGWSFFSPAAEAEQECHAPSARASPNDNNIEQQHGAHTPPSSGSGEYASHHLSIGTKVGHSSSSSSSIHTCVAVHNHVPVPPAVGHPLEVLPLRVVWQVGGSKSGRWKGSRMAGWEGAGVQVALVQASYILACMQLVAGVRQGSGSWAATGAGQLPIRQVQRQPSPSSLLTHQAARRHCC